MSLLVVGLSHRSAPVSVLERASLSADSQAKLLQDTLAAEPAAEAAVLATCNRIELYADVDKFHAGVAELSTLLAQHSGVGLDELTPYLYVHYEDRAVHHLFSVACGLDSMVVGEGQILGQIKDALALGQVLHTAGRLLNDLFQQALRVGKRAHSETGIDRAGQSLVTFGLEQLADGRDPVAWAKGKRALVIGAGSMSSLAAATLARTGVAEIVVANRTRARADRLVEILGQAGGTGVAAHAVEMAAVSDELTRADVVVSCTGATGLVLSAEAVAGALGLDPAPAYEAPAVPVAGPPVEPDEQHAAWVENGSATATAQARAVRRIPAQSTGPVRLALLDLAMPRDIDGGAARLDGVRLVDIESLAEASADAPMAADVDQVRSIVADEVAAFGAAQRAAHITPTVVALRTMAAGVVAGEIARLDGRLPDLDEKQRAEISQTVRRVVDKLLHAPTVRVKQLASEPGGAGYADALRELFDLDPQTVAAVSRADLNDPNRGRS
ncbi:glutamyl-tRNA reductase [Streptomyces poriferorum]|uniref:Glutamyl-tRNA reductase n=1 Tax=Streptomyces poriferorum TaxID=2798799 RepID=A0ABY9ISU3_9ACTN|nr:MULTISPECIES: glutamyl-tRNA reductase [Streptomyces]WSQ45601.1 glutamyl-tRNA reductase [Streptomyces sp. NBC_01220]MBW5253489.1 glutamyl-tRNA reductase [Streptomyces poriferorum]MBW5261348.1 glutamyl-tRNA reductase [Streptomyces poriferorum]MDP5312820.1 glutamyl-tRNA reductase [Streptomyces sp. Alt4]WLQ49161.1 glutamyl-tRNA reductase [Streptomyces sp. Alt1]